MNSQQFHVQINLELEAVTCPGVWLCSHGYMEITIKVMGYFFRTSAMDPYFPLLCHDRFKVEGYFQNVSSISHLIYNLSRENLEITLWQNSRRLAYYQGLLMDLLQYVENKLHCVHTKTRQLLMKATTAFPGIIAPKLEISSQFFIDGEILNLECLRICSDFPKNPSLNAQTIKDNTPTHYQRPCDIQTPISNYMTNTQKRKQKTVCHTRNLWYGIRKLPSKAPSFSSDNSHTSVGICDIEHDGNRGKCDDYHHNKYCELCRLYQEVFLKEK